jgi:hypothetical protein
MDSGDVILEDVISEHREADPKNRQSLKTLIEDLSGSSNPEGKSPSFCDKNTTSTVILPLDSSRDVPCPLIPLATRAIRSFVENRMYR